MLSTSSVGSLSVVNEGNEGAGSGEGFLNAFRQGDRVLVWARAKVRSRPRIWF